MRAGTIVASNYLAMAAVLAESFVRHHPDSTFAILVVDDPGDPADRPEIPAGVELVGLDRLDLGDAATRVMATIYDVMELSTAVKPSFLRLLLDGGPSGSVACYLDPDIEVHAPFDDLVEPARRTGIVLTPHVLHPVPRDGKKVSEGTIMQSGMFNCGFVAVADPGRPFVDWWDERLRFDADVDFEAAHFTDQRWVDWVPVLFEYDACRDPGMNVAWWNVHERDLRIVDGTPMVGDGPLRFAHFSGYDPENPDLLSKHQLPAPRVDHAPGTPMRALAEAYGRRLVDAGHLRRRSARYGWSTSVDGVELTPEIRRTVRHAVLDEVGEDVAAPERTVPDAFGGGVGTLGQWLAERGLHGPGEGNGDGLTPIDDAGSGSPAAEPAGAVSRVMSSVRRVAPPRVLRAGRRAAAAGDRLVAATERRVRASWPGTGATGSSTDGVGGPGPTGGRRFALLHVPKSAGSAVTAALVEALPDHEWDRRTFDDSMLGRFRGLPTVDELRSRILFDGAELADVDAAAGHFSLPTLLRGFDLDDIALVVREPRSRLLSHYEFWRGLPAEVHEMHHPWTDSLSAVDADFDEWLVDPDVIHQTDNVVVRFLLAGHPDIPDTAEIPHDRMGSLSAEAVRRVRRLGWVGTVEQGTATWESLSERIGAPLRIEQVNVTERRPDRPTDVGRILSPTATALLAARTAGDARVWHEVARLTGVENPGLVADTAWNRRLAGAVAASS